MMVQLFVESGCYVWCEPANNSAFMFFSDDDGACGEPAN